MLDRKVYLVFYPVELWTGGIRELSTYRENLKP